MTGWPQYTVIVLYGMSLGASLVMDGKPRLMRDRSPMICSFWATVFAKGVMVWLLWAGGFFQ